MTDETQPILFSVDGSIARITLNRPEKRNALNDAMIDGLKNALRKANSDESVRVIVLNAAGKDFCSGADLSSLQKISQASVSENVDDARALMELFTLIREVQVPVVAAVHGRALAGGCGLACACDLIAASRSARFGYPEVKIGFVPAMVMAILRRNVSEKRAFELVTRGAEIQADEAMQIGLINKVFNDDSFETEVDNYLAVFATMSKTAIALTKQLLYQMDGMALREALESGVDVNVIARMTDDCQKGISRFLKRA
jgi:methylglutaconyl-CoA hydratase